jgi:hypothetical protein
MQEGILISNEEYSQKIENKDAYFANRIRKEVFGDCPHVGIISTPYSLCCEMLDQLPDLNDKNILIWFNPEFWYAIVKRYPNAHVTMITGSKNSEDHKFKGIDNIVCIDPNKDLETVVNVLLEIYPMKFDVVIGNPPYQAHTKGGNGQRDLWDKFVIKSLELCKDSGHVALIHPSKWRKPEHKLFKEFKNLVLKFLSIHNAEDGQKTFKCSTRYDWYILQNKKNEGEKTVIKDENGVTHKIDLKDLPFLPNFNFTGFWKLLANQGNEVCNVIYSSSFYDARRPYMSKIKTEQNILPCIYSLKKDNRLDIIYSSKNLGHFTVSKVIISGGKYPYPLIDMEGKYGMCNNAFAIQVDSVEEAEGIVKALNSEKFKQIFISTKWSNFQIDYKMFKYFKKDFWKEFI